MALIDLQGLTFGYEGSFETVFENLSLRLDSGWRLGLVGRNGRGKSTLLGLMSGRLAPQAGRVVAQEEMACFPPPVADGEALALEVLQTLAPEAQEWQLFREAGLLALDGGALYRPFNSLSGGEQVKALLIPLFLREGCYPLLDEPTANLDLAARRCVAQYLAGKGGFLLVSHDRAFLDGCVDHILALNKTGPELCAGSFSTWYGEKLARDRAEAAQNERLQGEIGRLGQAARRTADWSRKVEAAKQAKNSGVKPDKGYIGHKSAKMMQRAKSMEARRAAALEEKEGLLKDAEKQEALKLTPLVYRSETLLTLEAVAIRYANGPACAPVSFALKRGQRLALCGGNGCGKTSLLRLIAGEEPPHTGALRLGGGLAVSYVPQRAEGLHGRPLDYARRQGLEETRFLTILRKLDFDRSLFERDMAGYSQGQKKKVLLARSLSQNAHLYLWDEPLGYIDLFSRIQLQELLLRFAPTLLFVEHDEAFLDAVATERVVMAGNAGGPAHSSPSFPARGHDGLG